jgi:hypothetical protein
MSGDLTYASPQMATNDFVDDLKSLSLSQTSNAYSDTIERLLIQLKQATPNGLLENKPFALTIVDHLHRIIPIFDKKLSEDNENSRQTNLFLQTLSNVFQGQCVVDLFLAIKDLSSLTLIFQNYIPLLKQTYFTDNHNDDHLINCLLPIISFSSMLISVNENKFPPNFFSYLLEFTKNNWQSKQRNALINNILGFIKICSKNPLLVPLIIRSEWPNACIEWLKTPGSKPSFKTDFLICLLLQKLSRHAVAVEVLNQLNCIEALTQNNEQRKQDYNEEEYSCIDFIQSVTYALLVEADEIKRNSMLADKLMCQVLEQLVSFTIRASEDKIFVYKSCHISEIVCILSKLFGNDDIVLKCLRESNQLFDCLSKLTIQFAMMTSNTIRVLQPLNDETLTTLANLLWSISFHEFYHEKFKSNAKLMQTLSNLATSSSLYITTKVKSIPEDVCSLKKAAEGILWNLKSSHLTQVKVQSEQQPLIMISYSHSDTKFCQDLVDHLSYHIPVWVDYKQAHHKVAHSDDLWEEIAGAMETATVIVLIVSKEYYDSKSCRQELSYASDTLKKRIVPVYTPNQQYKANGWLGIRIAGQKYVHFGRKDFTDALNELLSIIGTEQKSTIIPKSSHAAVSIHKAEQKHSLKTWTSDDIRKWFVDNHIHNDLIALLADQFHTGTALIIYARHLKQFYQYEYIQILSNYYKKFNGKQMPTVDFITFVDALWRLREEYDPQSRTEDARENYRLSSAMNFPNEGMTWL